MENIINANELVFAYSGEKTAALNKVTVKVKKGEMVAVLGHNGSGKSTFAKHLNAILLPQGGVCYVGGINTADEDKLLDLRRTAGMVFQNPDNQIVATIVEEDVAFGLENLKVPTDTIRSRTAEMAAYFGIEEWFEGGC